MKKQSDVHFRVTTEKKALMVRMAAADGLRFSVWARESLESLVAAATGKDGNKLIFFGWADNFANRANAGSRVSKRTT